MSIREDMTALCELMTEAERRLAATYRIRGGVKLEGQSYYLALDGGRLLLVPGWMHPVEPQLHWSAAPAHLLVQAAAAVPRLAQVLDAEQNREQRELQAALAALRGWLVPA